MKYLVMWAKDSDYSAWHTAIDGYDSQEPQLCDSLEDARDFLAVVATRNPDMVGRVYAVSSTYRVEVDLTPPIVRLMTRGGTP